MRDVFPAWAAAAFGSRQHPTLAPQGTHEAPPEQYGHQVCDTHILKLKHLVHIKQS